MNLREMDMTQKHLRALDKSSGTRICFLFKKIRNVIRDRRRKVIGHEAKCYLQRVDLFFLCNELGNFGTPVWEGRFKVHCAFFYAPDIMYNLEYISSFRDRKFKSVIGGCGNIIERRKAEILHKPSDDVKLNELGNHKDLFDAFIRVVDAAFACFDVNVSVA